MDMERNDTCPNGREQNDTSHHPLPIYELPADEPASSCQPDRASTDEAAPPPAYSAAAHDDGRIDVHADSVLVRTLSRMYTVCDRPLKPSSPAYSQNSTTPLPADLPKPSGINLNIVIQAVGSRGDVQPFIALGNELQGHGHRVRLATHDMFEDFVRKSGLEFYPIGGDPAKLMAYMVKNPGLIPKMQSLRAGEIHRKRVMVRKMLEGCWRSCLQPDILSGRPFVADAIIANPPSFAHIHCAQALSIPVHLVFTMPWSKTTAFPHPLANLNNTDHDPRLLNYVSYGVINWMTWQGLGDIINEWRRQLDLEEVAMTEGPDLADTLKIPFTYCWSPALVSKPVDWPPHIDVCGFFFRSPPAYEPPADLVAFLQVGSRPVYIGFGSIGLEDPARMASTILQAVAASGCRAIVSKGWSGLSGVQDDKVYFVGDCPHEWLFQQVSAVVHHGGAGTTACGLRYGKPTAVIPFFGDQPFWGEMIAARGAGPRPIYHQHLTADNLAAAIRFCLTPEAGIAAAGIAESMGLEDGIRAAVDSFHRHLPISRLQCDILPDQPAVWSAKVGKSTVRLSKAAAEVVLSESVVKAKALRMHEISPIYIETRRWDPITGGSSAILGTTADLTKAFTGTFYKPIQEYAKYHEEKVETKDPAANKELGSNGEMIIDSKRSVESELSSSAAPDQKSRSLGTKMAASSAKSIGMFAPMAAKGMLVDIPLALTEGLRNLPRSFGDEVRDHEPITNWKSGAAVAGKTFVNGFAEGISDVVMKPYQGAVKEGSIGAVKGVGKGMLSLTSKTGAAMFGLMAYPSAGVAKSLRSSMHSSTRKMIFEARHQEGKWLVKNWGLGEIDSATILDRFRALTK